MCVCVSVCVYVCVRVHAFFLRACVCAHACAHTPECSVWLKDHHHDHIIVAGVNQHQLGTRTSIPSGPTLRLPPTERGH